MSSSRTSCQMVSSLQPFTRDHVQVVLTPCVQARMLPHCSNLWAQSAGSQTSSNATGQPLPPAGCYLEVFGRQNNLRNYWVTVGNEVSGSTTSPAEFKARLGELRAQRPGTCPIAANQQSL